MFFTDKKLVADPGFPRGGGANSPGGAPTYDFAKFPQKLHEIERIWIGGGVVNPSCPLRSATENVNIHPSLAINCNVFYGQIDH